MAWLCVLYQHSLQSVILHAASKQLISDDSVWLLGTERALTSHICFFTFEKQYFRLVGTSEPHYLDQGFSFFDESVRRPSWCPHCWIMYKKLVSFVSRTYIHVREAEIISFRGQQSYRDLWPLLHNSLMAHSQGHVFFFFNFRGLRSGQAPPIEPPGLFLYYWSATRLNVSVITNGLVIREVTVGVNVKCSI